MALEFRKRLIRKPGKKAQYALAISALLLALCMLFCWMYVRHKLDKMPTTDPSSDDTATGDVVYTADDKANLLVIYDSDIVTRFSLIQADPAQNRLYIAAIPGEMSVDGDQTLTTIFKKSGASRSVDALSDTLDLPLRHYVAITENKAASWFNRLDGGLPFILPATIELTNGGVKTSLTAGKHTLGTTQVIAVLNHTAWPEGSLNDRVFADIVAAMLDAYMTQDHNLTSDFSALANLAKTSLRIGDFNDHKTMLFYLASKNDGKLCQVLLLPTTTGTEGNLLPDTSKLKKTPLYE